MQKKIPLLLIAVLGLVVSGFSQQQAIKYLTVGDTMPNITFSVMNSSKPTAKLSDYKGKYIILDFWATYCRPCVAALPKMEKLQQQFKDSLQIIPVTDEKKTAVNALFKRLNVILPELVFITDDTSFTKYLSFKIVPHEVWLNNAGKIIAITTGQYVNADNIRQVLKTGKADWPVKDEVYKFPFKTTSVFGLTPAVKTATINSTFYSGITGYTEGIAPLEYFTEDSIKNFKRYSIYNYPVLALYAKAYDKFPDIMQIKRCIIHVGDSSDFVYNKQLQYRDAWTKKHWYTYEAILPQWYSRKQIASRMIQDIDFFFGFHSSVKEQTVLCWILKTKDTLLLKKTSKTGIPEQEIIVDKNGCYTYKQDFTNIYEMVEIMNNNVQLLKLPLVIDETEYRNTISLNLSLGTDIGDINVWRSQLNKYGLELVVEKRNLEMLIFTENK